MYRAKLILGPLFCMLFVAGFSQRVIEGQVTDAHTAPEKAVLAYNKGVVFFNNKQYPQAIAAYRQAIVIDSDYTDAIDNLGLSFYQISKVDSAEFYFARSLKKMPTGLTALQNMGMIKENNKEYDKALDYYNTIIKLSPQSPEGYYNASRILSNTGKYEDALQRAITAEKLYVTTSNPYISDCHYQLLIIYFYMSNKPKAKEYLAICKKEGVQVDAQIENGLK